MKILEHLIGNLKSELTLSDISKTMKQKYPQTYRSISTLLKKRVVKTKQVGKSRIIQLDFLEYHPEYTIAEIERTNKAVKDKNVLIVLNKLLRINKQFICVIFGSYASGQSKEGSDIDLLFVIPDEYDINQFEKLAKNALSVQNTDINVITEDSLFEMWAAPEKLNVGNELLRSHVVLIGAEGFINLVRKHYVGR